MNGMNGMREYSLEERDTSDGGRQMEQLVDHLDRKVLARRFAEKLGRVAEALTSSQRKLLVMIVVEHKSRDEIMRALGIAERTFRQRLSMLVKKISKSFPKTTPPPPLLG